MATIPSDRPTLLKPDELPTELVITDITVGEGRAAQAGDFLVVDYVGIRSVDGVEFDNSYDRGQASLFPLGAGELIEGWDVGLLGVKPGGVRRLDIPSELAYGDETRGKFIRANEDISFLVTVRAVVPPSGPEDAPDIAELQPIVDSEELQIFDLVEGSGSKLAYGDTAVIHTMALRGDTLEILDNSWERSTPLLLLIAPGPGDWIEGFDRGMADIRVGTTRIIGIPYTQAYGPEGSPDRGLPPETDLIIIVEVLAAY